MVVIRKKEGGWGGGKSNLPMNDNIGRDSPNLYRKTIDKLALYSSTQFKNGSDVVAFLRSEKYVRPEVPIVPDEPTAKNQCIWEYKMNNHLKSECILKNNICNLYTVLISLCDTEVRNQVRPLTNYKE